MHFREGIATILLLVNGSVSGANVEPATERERPEAIPNSDGKTEAIPYARKGWPQNTPRHDNSGGQAGSSRAVSAICFTEVRWFRVAIFPSGITYLHPRDVPRRKKNTRRCSTYLVGRLHGLTSGRWGGATAELSKERHSCTWDHFWVSTTSTGTSQRWSVVS